MKRSLVIFSGILLLAACAKQEISNGLTETLPNAEGVAVTITADRGDAVTKAYGQLKDDMGDYGTDLVYWEAGDQISLHTFTLKKGTTAGEVSNKAAAFSMNPMYAGKRVAQFTGNLKSFGAANAELPIYGTYPASVYNNDQYVSGANIEDQTDATAEANRGYFVTFTAEAPTIQNEVTGAGTATSPYAYDETKVKSANFKTNAVTVYKSTEKYSLSTEAQDGDLVGMTAILVMSGETTEAMLAGSKTVPDLTYGRLADMIPELTKGQ